MSVALLLITHDSIASSLLETATNMLGICPLAIEILSINQDFDSEENLLRAEELCTKLENGDGLLILTDMYGSTPSNIAIKLIDRRESRIVITGLNLSMLIRVLNYPQLALSELAKKAESGAKDGVLIVDKNSSC